MTGLFICCSWRSMPWCVLDNLAHIVYSWRLAVRRRTEWQWICPNVPKPASWICKRHDYAITGEWIDE